MPRYVYLLLALACLYGLHLVALGDDEAMAICQKQHSYDTCHYIIYR